MSARVFIANTDFGWFSHLLHRAEPDEVEFGSHRRTASRRFRQARPLLPRLGATHRAITGFGASALRWRIHAWNHRTLALLSASCRRAKGCVCKRRTSVADGGPEVPQRLCVGAFSRVPARGALFLASEVSKTSRRPNVGCTSARRPGRLRAWPILRSRRSS
jgi:hypothetical protein